MKTSLLRRSMFLPLLLRSVRVRRGRAFTALLGIVIVSAVATAMLNLYVDVESKLTKEFSKFGANIIVAARPGQSLTPESLTGIKQNLNLADVAVPLAYAVAKTTNGMP